MLKVCSVGGGEGEKKLKFGSVFFCVLLLIWRPAKRVVSLTSPSSISKSKASFFPAPGGGEVTLGVVSSEEGHLLGAALSKTQELVLRVAAFLDSRLLRAGGKFRTESQTAERGHLLVEQSSLVASLAHVGSGCHRVCAIVPLSAVELVTSSGTAIPPTTIPQANGRLCPCALVCAVHALAVSGTRLFFCKKERSRLSLRSDFRVTAAAPPATASHCIQPGAASHRLTEGLYA